MTSAIDTISDGIEGTAASSAPKAGSLKEFLLVHARVKLQGGEYGPYTFEGREVIEHITDRFDHILGSYTGEPLPDSTLDICGGAQWGKTVWALNTGTFLTSCRFLNWGFYLPDENLVENIADSKFRPDVIEQIEGLQSMMEVGAYVNAKGKKMVNRKGAFMVTDGTRKAFGMFVGLGKVPTSLSFDAVMEDEKDDIPEKNSKFVTGRMTASALRFKSSIGTQRKHGAGQHKQFMAGTQEVQMFEVPGEGRMINIEETWPACCRLAIHGVPRITDPQLTYAGNFQRGEGESKECFDYDPTGTFYIADPETGKAIDRNKPIFVMRRPDRERLRKWSIRVSQVAIAAIDLNQPVSRWQDAVADPKQMEVFYCDVLALPKNSTQKITPEIIIRSRALEDPFDLRLAMRPGCRGFGGIDTGNNCWFFGREVQSDFIKRALWAEKIPLGDLVRRAEELFHRLGLAALFIDAHPAVDQARELTYRLNGLADLTTWPIPKGKPELERIELPGGVVWDGPNNRWENIRCAVVQFTLKPGGGNVHKLGLDPQAGYTKFYPIIQCSRFDLINRAINEFMGAGEQVTRVSADKTIITDQVMRLPQKVTGSPAIIDTLEAHLVTGSEQDEKGEFVDGCENHLLLADGYSALAELVAGFVLPKKRVAFQSVRTESGPNARGRGMAL